MAIIAMTSVQEGYQNNRVRVGNYKITKPDNQIDLDLRLIFNKKNCFFIQLTLVIFYRI